MTDFIYMMSQAKLAEYYDTRTDLPIRKYVLIANMLRNSNIQEEDKREEQWLDTCLDALDQQEDEMHDDDNKNQSITVRHYSFTPKDHQQNQALTSQSNQQQVASGVIMIVCHENV